MNNTHIYVMERGFVLVGRVHEQSNCGLFRKLHDCAVIRRWGTTQGLGELAMKGPIPDKTILEPEPDGTEIRISACYRIIPCNEKSWAKWTTNKKSTTTKSTS